MLWGSSSDRVILEEAEQRRMHELFAAFKTRRAEARRINGAFYGDHMKEMVETRLRARYDDSMYGALKFDSGITTWDPLPNDVVDKAVTEWDEGSTQRLLRRLADGKTEDFPSESFDNHCRAADFDDVMDHNADIAFLHGTTFVMPEVMYAPRIGLREFSHNVLTPEHFDLEPVPYNRKDYQAVSVYWGDEMSSSDPLHKVTWTLDEWAVFRLEDKEKTAALGSVPSPQDKMWVLLRSGPNKFGRIPGQVFYHRRAPGKLWGKGYGKMLVDAGVDVNCARSFLSYIMSLQIKFPAGQFDAMPEGQNYGPGKPINYGQGERTAVEDMQTDVQRFLDVFIREPRKATSVAVGLSNNEWDPSTVEASGAALIVQNANRDARAMKRRRIYREGLVELYWLGLCVLQVRLTEPETDGEYAGMVIPISGYEGTWVPGQYDKNGEWVENPYDQPRHAPASLVLPPYEPGVAWYRQPWVFVVDVADREYPMLPSERKAKEDDDLEKGRTNPAKELRKENPDITTDEMAYNQVLENKRITAELQKAGAPAAPTSLLKPRAPPPPAPVPPTTEPTPKVTP